MLPLDRSKTLSTFCPFMLGFLVGNVRASSALSTRPSVVVCHCDGNRCNLHCHTSFASCHGSMNSATCVFKLCKFNFLFL